MQLSMNCASTMGPNAFFLYIFNYINQKLKLAVLFFRHFLGHFQYRYCVRIGTIANTNNPAVQI